MFLYNPNHLLIKIPFFTSELHQIRIMPKEMDIMNKENLAGAKAAALVALRSIRKSLILSD